MIDTLTSAGAALADTVTDVAMSTPINDVRPVAAAFLVAIAVLSYALWRSYRNREDV